MKVIDDNLKWARPLSRIYGYKPKYIIWHHTAGEEKDIFQIHQSHIKMGDKGCPYNYVIYKNGEVHQGRPEGMWAAHTLGYNNEIGVACIGRFHLFPMNLKQRKAARDLDRALKAKTKSLIDKGHGSMPGNSTQCPGRFFPMKYITTPASPLVARKYRGQMKTAMVKWAEMYNKALPEDKFDIPKVSSSTWWGSGAKLLAARISYRARNIDAKVEYTQRPESVLYQFVKRMKAD